MNTPPTTIEGYLDHCFEKFVQPLLDELHLRVVTRRIDSLGGLYEVLGQHLIVRLINDRGLASLEVAPSSHPKECWDVELIAGLFQAAPGRGVRRLNLEEQASLLRTRWEALNDCFTGARYQFTRKRLEELGHQRAAALFGPDV